MEYREELFRAIKWTIEEFYQTKGNLEQWKNTPEGIADFKKEAAFNAYMFEGMAEGQAYAFLNDDEVFNELVTAALVEVKAEIKAAITAEEAAIDNEVAEDEEQEAELEAEGRLFG